MMKRFALFVVLALAGCDKPPPEIVLVEPEARAIEYPAECVSDDPAWQEMPDSELDKATIARVTKRNKNNYSEVQGKRRICRRALTAQTKKVS